MDRPRGSINVRGQADLPDERKQVFDGDQAGEDPSLVGPSGGSIHVCGRCGHLLKLHDEQGFCTVPGCGCTGLPEASPGTG
jgi:hypothetical protein